MIPPCLCPARLSVNSAVVLPICARVSRSVSGGYGNMPGHPCQTGSARPSVRSEGAGSYPKACRSMEGSDGYRAAEFEHRGRRLVVTWRHERARKNGHDRRKTVERLKRKLERRGVPRDWSRTVTPCAFLQWTGVCGCLGCSGGFGVQAAVAGLLWLPSLRPAPNLNFHILWRSNLGGISWHEGRLPDRGIQVYSMLLAAASGWSLMPGSGIMSTRREQA